MTKLSTFVVTMVAALALAASASASTWRMHGIVDYGGTFLNGVTITLHGPQTGTTTSARMCCYTDGAYIFDVTAAGSYYGTGYKYYDSRSYLAGTSPTVNTSQCVWVTDHYLCPSISMTLNRYFIPQSPVFGLGMPL
jgi:hypothetical protein